MDPTDPDPDPQHWLEGTVPNFCTYEDVFKFIFRCLFVEKNQSQLTELCLQILVKRLPAVIHLEKQFKATAAVPMRKPATAPTSPPERVR